MRIVLDTNTTLLVSISGRSPYYPIYQALIKREYQLVVTTDILLEYEEVIGREMGAEVADDVLSFLSLSSSIIKLSTAYRWRLITADPDDDKFVDAAVAAGAHYLVSDDRHLRVLQKTPYPKVNLLLTDDFLDLILKGQHL